MCSIYLLNSYLPLNYWWCFSSMGSYSNYHIFQAQAMLFAICRSFIIGQGTCLKELRLSEVLKTTKGVFMDFFWCNSKKWKCTCTGSLNIWTFLAVHSVLSLMVKDKLPLVVVQIVDISAHSVEFPPFQ